MSNRLQHETSPYLRQHADNPVNWYPWCSEAFERAEQEDKPIFLSIGYSTCHWCHVMAHESFEDEETADFLNRHFISIKVDREERPDIDNIYMKVCQAFTGGGGWPTSIFMTAEQKPFFAGTYYPKRRRRGMISFMELLSVLLDKWENDREALFAQANEIVFHLSREHNQVQDRSTASDLLNTAAAMFKRSFDRKNGGFGRAPKFPTPHNLLFLISYDQHTGGREHINMADQTLMQMYRGGLFDHIGGGFSRYSTDEKFLVPHFEKMLYDNALLMTAYCRMHAVTEDERKAELYLDIARKTADYVLREMTSADCAFYSAQDADSEGAEGRYYVFDPDEIERVLGKEEALDFCRYYGISAEGNFEGKNILNLLNSDPFAPQFEHQMKELYQYRKQRYDLHLDDKILTSWNSLMIAAMCILHHESRDERYLNAAQRADRFIHEKLIGGDELHASYASGKLGAKAFLDDYAAYCYAQLALYRITLRQEYLDKAQTLCRTAIEKFYDSKRGGFYFTENNGEKLFMRSKETYDGAMPSGNSMMAWNLVMLARLTDEELFESCAGEQVEYLLTEASAYSAGHSMFLCALLQHENSGTKVTVVSENDADMQKVSMELPFDVSIISKRPSQEYPLKNGRTTFYVCTDKGCMPPANDLCDVLKMLNI